MTTSNTNTTHMKEEVIWWLEVSHHIPMDIIRYILSEWSCYEPIENNQQFRECIDLWFEYVKKEERKTRKKTYYMYNEERYNMIFKYGHISDWNTKNVTDMCRSFEHRQTFNEDISRWNVSNVTDMKCMFYNCHQFNCDLSQWDVSNVTNMSYMFNNCEQFNCDLSQWNVSNVTVMTYMFSNCHQFNSDISQWNVNNLKNMFGMFYNCKQKFNCDLSQWDVSNIINKRYIYF